MLQLSDHNPTLDRRYALCVGIGTYTNRREKNLRYAVSDAAAIAERLADPQRGNFAVRVLTEPTETTKAALGEAVEQLLSAPDRQAEDLTLLYFSCHGTINNADGTFCLVPSDAVPQTNEVFDQTTLIGISDLARWFLRARALNVVMLLDVCHSGGAGVALQRFQMNLDADLNLFIIGAARQDRRADESSRVKHGVFTYCLLRAFEQPPSKDGWLTISQIHNFVSNEIPWFAKDQPIQLQSWSVSVNPNLLLLRNPGYPEDGPLPPLWNVPWQRNIFFTGQEDILSRLASMLQGEQKIALTQRYALNGLGGIGKTQIAVEYAYRHHQDYHAVLWGRADTREALISTFVHIAHLLGLPQKDEKDQMVIVEAVKAWLMNRSKWLFILDNADELALIKEFMPPAFMGHLLLTTRAQAMGGLARKLEVEVMQPEIGALLLLRRAGLLAPEAPLEEAASPSAVAMAKELCKELGGLPLALDQAGAYMEEAKCNLSDYQQRYHMHRADLLRRRGGLVADHPEPVATTWSIAFEKIEETYPAAAILLQLCAFLHPDAIAEEIITLGCLSLERLWTSRLRNAFSRKGEISGLLRRLARDPLIFDQAITVLQAYSLLRRDPQEHLLTIHRLVQAVLRDSKTTKEVNQWRQRAAQVVNAARPDVQDMSQWDACERWFPHAIVCATWNEQEQMFIAEAGLLLNDAGHYLLDRGRYMEAEPLLRRALSIYEQKAGVQHPFTALSLNNLAMLYQNQGKYAEAEPLLKRALSIYEQKVGAQHLSTALSLNNLAMLYQNQGKYVEAEPLLKRALSIYEQKVEAQHPLQANSLNNLAMLYQTQRKYAEAEPLLRRALNICEQELGPQHPLTAAGLNNLALLSQSQGKYAEAEPLYQRALSICEQQLGPQHPLTATVLDNLASLYQNQGKYAEAEPLSRRALLIREEQLGPDHPDTASNLTNLARFSESQGKYAEAESLYQRALSICEQQLGPQHPDTATVLNYLIRLYKTQERYGDAESLYQHALLTREGQLGSKHPDTVQSLNDLASLYYTQGKYAEAEPLCQRVLSIREEQLGSDHPDTATSLNNLALLYQNQGRYGEAESLCQRALTIREQKLGAAHPDTAIILNNLAWLSESQRKYTEAESLYQRALTIREQELGLQQHPDTAIILNNLTRLYKTQGRYGEAESLYQRILLIREEQLGSEHPNMVQSLNDLASLYYTQGKYAEAELLYQRALTIREQKLGATHPDTAIILNNLAHLYTSQGKYAEAEPLYQRALTIREQVLGSEHLDTANSVWCLADLSQQQQHYQEAKLLYRRALAIFERTLGSEHLNTQQIQQDYASLLQIMRNDVVASELEQDS